MQGIPSASELIRNLSQLTIPYEVVEERGRFRVVRFPRLVESYPVWVVNERGNLWEPADSVEEALRYFDTNEARTYQQGVR